jgi:DNA-binding NarL/FixJ family response regulator
VRRTLVVVDDDTSLRFLLRTLIAADDRFLVLGEAADGVGALEVVDELDPDLLLLDLGMPHMDGLQVLERIGGRRRPRTVVLTGFADDETHARAIGLGAAACLVKGRDFHRLLEVLADAG